MASDILTNNNVTPVSDIAGLILSAGASSRMGMPKALLKYNDGSTLLTGQTELMQKAGLANVGIVIGSKSNMILEAHSDLDVRWIENKEWERGQFSSIQTGLKALSKLTTTGIILLPVDVIGVNKETIHAIIETALLNEHLQVITPEFNKRGGHPIYLSLGFCKEIIATDLTSDDARLDVQIKKASKAMRLPLEDPSITRNINTQEEWKKTLDAV